MYTFYVLRTPIVLADVNYRVFLIEPLQNGILYYKLGKEFNIISITIRLI